MVAKFRGGKSLKQILTYNECKVTEGIAQLIGEGGYGKDPGELSFQEKLSRLTDLARRNWRTTNNAMHISLSFSRKDQLDERRLNIIVKDYLDCIGFGGQPYLVYKHVDTAHPHVHIVSTNIDRNGKNIDFYFRCLGKSFKAARALEKKYSLEYACGPRERAQTTFTLPPVEYGKCELIGGISQVVNEVLRNYRFTSLDTFNLILSQYNIMADRGSVTSEMYANGGLLYRATRNGKRIGVPVKASSVEGKPTLGVLQSLFPKNEAARIRRKDEMLRRLDSVIHTRVSQAEFLWSLRYLGISAVLTYSEKQVLHDIIYIDNRIGVVFDGNELGRAYSAAELSVRFSNFQRVFPRLRTSDSGSGSTSCYMSCAVRDGRENWESLRESRLRESEEHQLKRGMRMRL